MTGVVDAAGRALLAITVSADGLSSGTTVQAWIDTGFTGELTLPIGMIRQFGLVMSGSIDAILADGSSVELETYTIHVDWFGRVRSLEVIANDGPFPLLGVGLLLGRELKVDYTNLTVSLLHAAKVATS